MAFVRKCEQCGKTDERERYASATEAADQGAFSKWTCPNCAWTEFELVDESQVGSAEASAPTR